MPNSEYVLCINKSSLPPDWVKPRTVLPMTRQEFIAISAESGFNFTLRRDAENNPSLKQVIPYVIIQTQNNALTAMYSRAGSEKRLHNLKSIGIGGHINPEDQQTENFNHILTAGMHRELSEELIAFPLDDTPEFVGVISEDLTEVGQVHLGAVFRIKTSRPDAYHPGEELFEFQWIETDKLNDYDLELWSELALELIHNT